MRVARSWNRHVASAEDRANKMEAQALGTFSQTSESRPFVEELNWTVNSKHAPIAVLINAELIGVWCFITVAILESKVSSPGQFAVCAIVYLLICSPVRLDRLHGACLITTRCCLFLELFS